jgi:hypothetical protein
LLWKRLSVNVLPVSDHNDQDDKLAVMYLINDSIIAYAYPPSFAASQFAAPMRAGILG